MQYMRVKCIECGEIIEVPVGSSSYGCIHCGHFERGSDEAGSIARKREVSRSPTPQLDEPQSPVTIQTERIDEAESYFLQATFILHSLQANISVYGSNSNLNVPEPADVDLALKYIDRSLEIWPENPKYINLKALFLLEGKRDREGSMALFEKAHKLAPDDITILDNLEKTKKSASEGCFIATAAFNSETAEPVLALRAWRDISLKRSPIGRSLCLSYYRYSPRLADRLNEMPLLKPPARRLLRIIAKVVDPRQ